MSDVVGTGAIWFVAGLLVGVVYALSLVWTVGRLHPTRRSSSQVTLWLGYLLRISLITGFLTLALRRDIGAALWFVGGLWIARWFPVYLGWSGKINWSRFGGGLNE